jgi:hypothetical protein
LIKGIRAVVMLYRVLADLVLVLHLAFILFVVVGGLLALRWRRAPLLHLPAVIWGVFVEISSGICPLTPLENALRLAAGSSDYSGGFIEHYVVPAIYPPSLTQPTQLALAGFVVVANALVYLVVWRRRSIAQRRLAA